MRKHRGKGFSLFGNLKLRDKSIEWSLLQQAMLVSCIPHAMLVGAFPNPPRISSVPELAAHPVGFLSTKARMEKCSLLKKQLIRQENGIIVRQLLYRLSTGSPVYTQRLRCCSRRVVPNTHLTYKASEHLCCFWHFTRRYRTIMLYSKYPLV